MIVLIRVEYVLVRTTDLKNFLVMVANGYEKIQLTAVIRLLRMNVKSHAKQQNVQTFIKRLFTFTGADVGWCLIFFKSCLLCFLLIICMCSWLKLIIIICEFNFKYSYLSSSMECTTMQRFVVYTLEIHTVMVSDNAVVSIA